MKKIFAYFLCMVMCLQGVGALAYEDLNTIEPSDDVPVVNLISALGVMKGFDDGTFRPDDTLTRAEAAAIMVRLLGKENEALQAETVFDDVSENHWASGYINVAEENKIINGMGDKTFNPDGEVTYHQFVKMLVCILGYEPVAEAHGGWIGGGYLYTGSGQVTGFMKGVPGEFEKPIIRLTAARMVYNALEIEILEPDSFNYGIYGSGPCFPEYNDDKTILNYYLGYERIDGVITDCDENTTEVVITKCIYDNENADYTVGEKIRFETIESDLNELIGYTIVAYVDKKDGVDFLLAAAEKAGKNHLTVILTDLIEEFTSEKVVYYESEISKNTTETTIESFVLVKKERVEVGYNIIVNGKLAPDFNVYEEYKNLDEITFLDNDNDGDFEFVIVNVEK